MLQSARSTIVEWLSRCGLAAAAVLTWTSLYVTWFLVSGNSFTPGGTGCLPEDPNCIPPFAEVLPLWGALLFLTIGGLMLAVAVIPKLAPLGISVGIVEVVYFQLLVFDYPLHPVIASSALGDALLLSTLAGALAIGASLGLALNLRASRNRAAWWVRSGPTAEDASY
jgi:hypothetical protein